MAAAGVEYDKLVPEILDKGKPPLIVLLPGQIYGSGGLFMKMIEMTQKGRNMIFGDGSNYIPRIYVEDCAEAYIKAIEKMPIGEKFIIADDTPCTTKEFNEHLCKLMKKPKPKHLPKFIVKLVMGKMIFETVTMNCKVSNKKAKEMLGWKPKYPGYKEGLEATIEKLTIDF
jgi:nucleoside-diphosphate-sugar epimerase